MSAGNMDDGFDDPSDFNATQLSTLDEHLRCPICKEIFDATMLLSTCSHSFCALCIRRSLSTEQICPKCRKPAYESNLIHNYDLDNVVRQWRESRKFLISLERTATAPKQKMTINSAPASFDDDISGDFMPTIHSSSPTASPSTTSPISTRRSTRLSSQTIVSASPQGSPMQTSQSDISIVDITSPPQSYQTMPPVKADNSSTAECPVCWQQMDVKNTIYTQDNNHTCLWEQKLFIFIHIVTTFVNICIDLTRVESLQYPQNVYNLMTDKALNALLRSFNLPDSGDRATKIWRHKEYLNLYNANQDSHNPVSANVLVQRLQAIENSRAIQSKRKATDPEEHKALYADQFQSLINDVKRQKSNEDNV
ncbi:hypothetical protein MUCCIDRAFT_165339 [Mucor lusitanicus CBS 277.49]|uniref:Postreplication repair E3 ubiquitin-protein ligase RAD18 n=1 Tax=Mucor lusitanicus CBS 277.49 TaxID=747725 RepID=A0A168JPV9_MUCCL|nr:hypothetical protein MUCCIDRAFT_165339 [Mucor lusitanicus CBS 277.49]